MRTLNGYNLMFLFAFVITFFTFLPPAISELNTEFVTYAMNTHTGVLLMNFKFLYHQF